MEFSKDRSHRGEIIILSDAPPVGSYDLPEIELRAIKILEKSNNPLKTIDETGNGDKENVRIRTNSFQPDKLSKLNEKLESKLHKLELKNEELLRVQSLSKAELSQLKAELKSSSSANNSLKSQLEKSEASLARVPILKNQMAELTASFDKSRLKRDVQITELKATLKGTQLELSQSHSTNTDSSDQNLKLQLNHDDTQAMLSTTQETLTQTILAFNQSLSNQKNTESELLELKVSSTLNASIITSLESQLNNARDQINNLLQSLSESNQEKLSLKSQITELEADQLALLAVGAAEREDKLREKAREKEWRQRNRSDVREASALKEDLLALDDLIESDRSYIQLLRTEAIELGTERIKEAELLINEKVMNEIEKSKLKTTIANLRTQHDSLLVDNTQLSELHQEAELSLESLQSIQETLTLELEEFAQALETKEGEIVKLKVEKVKLTSNSNLLKSAEQSLLQQLQLAQAEITSLQSTVSQNLELSDLYSESRRRHAAAENLVLELTESNNDLLSHNNPHQRIRGVESLRNDLIDSRKAHLGVVAELSQKTTENLKLSRELEAYKAVVSINLPSTSTPSLPHSNRIRIIRPTNLFTEQEILPPPKKLNSLPYHYSSPSEEIPSISPPASAYFKVAELEEEEYDLVESIESGEEMNGIPDGMSSSVVRRGGREISEARREGWSSGSSGGRSERRRGERESGGGLIRGTRGPMSLSDLL